MKFFTGLFKKKIKKPATQLDCVIWHLENKKSLTSWVAIKEYGITRLSQYIYMMRCNGYNVVSIDAKMKNRFGNTVNYSIYKLVK